MPVARDPRYCLLPQLAHSFVLRHRLVYAVGLAVVYMDQIGPAPSRSQIETPRARVPTRGARLPSPSTRPCLSRSNLDYLSAHPVVYPLFIIGVPVLSAYLAPPCPAPPRKLYIQLPN